MKFIDKRTEDTVPFRRIKVGECFITACDGHINMKMCVDDYYPDACNTVDLVTGKQYYFSDDNEEVVAVKAEVTAIN